MTKTLIVPGLDASPAPHWQHWWAATEHDAITVELSQPDRPSPTLWETELAGMILRHPDSILVGHSLGAVLIARILTTWPHLRVRAALLVAPAETEGAERIGQFGAIPQMRLDVPTTVVASRNDPWMSFGRARHLARACGSKIIDMGFAGHINVASGFGPWAHGKELRDELAQRAAPAPHPACRIARTALSQPLSKRIAL
ncbi:MAG: alpha/beta hydrolase [Cypionkella sp.]|jgi:hypothetical protein|nr:alpha/beta hydrolase [Cypionkella sp.]